MVGLLALLPAAPVAFAEELFAEDIAPIRFADFQEEVSDVADGVADDGILLVPPLPIERLPIPSVLADSEGEVFVIEGAEILSGTIASQAPTSILVGACEAIVPERISAPSMTNTSPSESASTLGIGSLSIGRGGTSRMPSSATPSATSDTSS